MRKLVLTLVIGLLSLSHATAQRPWTLDECMDYAIAHNTQIRHLQNERQRRAVSTQASKDARLPRFSADMGGYVGTLHHSGDGNRFDANESLLNMGLEGVLPLYTGNRLSSQITANKYSLMAVEQDVRSAEKDIKVQVAAAYLQVLYHQGEATIARQRREVSQLLLQRARSLFDKGKRPESDVVEAVAMVTRDDALLVAAEGNVALAKLDMKLLLNLPDSTDFDVSELTDSIEAVPLLPSYDLYSQDYSRHPAVQSASYSILQAEQGVTTARSGYYPTLSLVGTLGTFWANLDAKASYSGQVPLLAPWGKFGEFSYRFSNEADWKRKNFLHGFVGLRLSVPIFNAFETKARIRTAKVNLEDARLAYDDARQRIGKDIRQAWQEAVTAQKRYEAEVKAVESGALAYRYAVKRYDAGMMTLFDLSQIRQQWFGASESALRMKYEYLIRKRILDIHTREY